ncbi:MAG: T9SS type A sorting domain-containing protein [Bacteroidia bacterium]
MKQFYMSSKKLQALVTFSLVALFNASSHAQCVPPPAPVAPGTIVCSGTSGSLSATGAGMTFNWFANSTGSLLATTPMYVTPTLTTSVTYYVAQYSTTTTGSLNIPSQTTTYSGNSRGYFFIAPTTMTITGVRVPNDNAGNYNVAIVKFPTVPPVYSAFTNTFTTLYLAQNQTGTTVVAVNIPVAYGDIIGVLGDRAGICSYASPAPFSNIAFGSYSVTLNRLGMQYPLATTAPQELWQEATGSIGRVELYSDLACLSPLASVTATVSNCTGIEELYGDDFHVSPNPASNFLNLKVSNELAGTAYIELYDALGKTVIKQMISEKETQINTSDLIPGIYIYKVYTSKKVIKTSKLVKS